MKTKTITPFFSKFESWLSCDLAFMGQTLLAKTLGMSLKKLSKKVQDKLISFLWRIKKLRENIKIIFLFCFVVFLILRQ